MRNKKPAKKKASKWNMDFNDEADNSNMQNKIYQCEGYNCPSETFSCDVEINSVEPDHEKVERRISCISPENIQLQNFNDEIDNPHKGFSLNIKKNYEASKVFKKFPKMKFPSFSKQYRN